MTDREILAAALPRIADWDAAVRRDLPWEVLFMEILICMDSSHAQEPLDHGPGECDIYRMLGTAS